MQESPARGRRKGKEKEKRCREDDVPPELSPEAKTQYGKLLELQNKLFCHVHSRPGMAVYCRILKASKSSEGGHQEVSHTQMTLWAKHMVSKYNSV